MKTNYIGLTALVILCLASTGFSAEFPGSKKGQKTLRFLSGKQVIAELKVLEPAVIECEGESVNVVAQPGKITMQVKNGVVDVKPDKGESIKISAPFIVVEGPPRELY